MTIVQIAVIDPETALREPLIRRICERVIDRLDIQPSSERTHSIRINLDPTLAPEVHHADSLSARAVAWASIDGVVAAGWATLDYRKHRRHGAREEREPYLDFRWSDAVENLIRERLHRPRNTTSYAMRWRALLAQANLPVTEHAIAKLSAAPVEISGRSIDDVFARFISIRDLADQPLLLREVASRMFWDSRRFSTAGRMPSRPYLAARSARSPSSLSFSTFISRGAPTPFSSWKTMSPSNVSRSVMIYAIRP